MKKFLIKTTLMIFLAGLSMGIILNLGDGYTDAFYLRFTTPPQNSLALGTSRAAQGIVPSILNATLSRDDIFNFSFTIEDSPYGPTYLHAIRKKLNPNAKDGIFILTVDPWSISSRSSNPNDSATFNEVDSRLAKTRFVNMNPNIPYLIQNFEGHYFDLLKTNSIRRLHSDGWLELTINMDSSVVATRTHRRLRDYKEIIHEYKFSEVRLSYLIKTIDMLKAHGQVYLVRLPIGKGIAKLEKEMMPDFDLKIQNAILHSNGYLDMMPLYERFVYIDGNHLWKSSSEEVSRFIASWIIEQENKKMYPVTFSKVE